MSTTPRLTLIGMYNYDSDLFTSLTLPTGIDRDTFINSLLLEHGEKCTLYSNIDFMKSAIGLWGAKHNSELERIAETLSEEYDPLYNYNRFEEFTDNETESHNDNDVHTISNSIENELTNNQNNNETINKTTQDVLTLSGSDEVKTENDVTSEDTTSAYNSNSYQADKKNVTDNDTDTTTNYGKVETHGYTDNSTRNYTSNVTENNTTNNTENGTKNNEGGHTKGNTHNAHLYGNIGVTESTQMLKNEIDTRIKYNLYDIACRIFANELLYMIY